MKNFWYLPIAAVIGATCLSVWGQANAGPPPEVSPGVVVVADVTDGSDTAKTEDSPTPLSTPRPTPTASITAIPDHAAPETQLVPAELQTYAPVQTTDGPTHDLYDDKGGLRAPGVSDDAPGDDKGGLRAPGVSDDAPGDDKGGLRDDKVSDDDAGDDKGGDR
jgi:hypothetical protein